MVSGGHSQKRPYILKVLSTEFMSRKERGQRMLSVFLAPSFGRMKSPSAVGEVWEEQVVEVDVLKGV